LSLKVKEKDARELIHAFSSLFSHPQHAVEEVAATDGWVDLLRGECPRPGKPSSREMVGWEYVRGRCPGDKCPFHARPLSTQRRCSGVHSVSQVCVLRLCTRQLEMDWS